MTKPKMMKLPMSDEQLQYVLDNVEPADRVKALVDAADIASGKRYQDLTASLSPKNEQAITFAPMFIGGDSMDIDCFITDVWNRPVTDDNYKAVMQLFRAWYKLIAPDEYHDPMPTLTLQEMGY